MTFDTIKRLFTPTSGVVCPRCEKPMEGHDEKACERRMSRRYFFGVAAGAAAAVGVKAEPQEIKIIGGFHRLIEEIKLGYPPNILWPPEILHYTLEHEYRLANELMAGVINIYRPQRGAIA